LSILLFRTAHQRNRCKEKNYLFYHCFIPIHFLENLAELFSLSFKPCLLAARLFYLSKILGDATYLKKLIDSPRAPY